MTDVVYEVCPEVEGEFLWKCTQGRTEWYEVWDDRAECFQFQDYNEAYEAAVACQQLWHGRTPSMSVRNTLPGPGFAGRRQR